MDRASSKRLLVVAALVVAGGLGNALMSLANMALSSPFFFDSVFTAVCAALFGPLAGALCGLVSHLFMELFHGWNGLFLPFAVCNIATGLIVGLFARSGRLATLTGAMLCTILVTLGNSVLGALVAFYLFGGITGHASDYLVTGFILVGQTLLAAAFWARIPANLIDKGIAVALAYFAARRALGQRAEAARLGR
ncbi:MAG TPA: ECF transporter S component [Rectinemataceae bacterium]|nr:ECF transporter S component [Rectinemataceae bacterium]